SGESEGIRPAADSGEEVILGVSHKVCWAYILDAPFIYVAFRYQARGHQLSQPSGGLRVELVVVMAGNRQLTPPPPHGHTQTCVTLAPSNPCNAACLGSCVAIIRRVISLPTASVA